MNTQKPRPRVLFEDVPDEVFEKMKAYAPTHERISSSTTMIWRDLHTSDWDLLVTFADEVAEGIIRHTLSFGATEVGRLNLSRRTKAAELCVPSGLNKSLARLVRDTVVPAVPDGEKPRWEVRRTSGMSGWPTASIEFVLGPGMPLLTVGVEEYVLAYWKKSTSDDDSLRHSIALPKSTSQPELWLRELIAELQIQEPDRFPPGVAWRDAGEWATVELQQAEADLKQVQVEQSEAMRGFDRRLVEAKSRVEAEKLSAEKGQWRLLTATDDELVDEVKLALEALGFLVEDRDKVSEGARLEDLRVELPSVPNWKCLAEVKGVTRGASSNAATQVAIHPRSKFFEQEHRYPDSLWYIVNAKRELPPDLRGPTFTNPEDVLAGFTAAGGVVIDTRDLYKALQKVKSGALSSEDVRTSLMNASGVWSGV